MTPSSERPASAAAGSSTEDRIIHAALELIAHDGLGAVTMMKVAETAGVSRQTLYNHYRDVDSIVAEAIGRHNRESIQLLESSLRVVDDPEGKLEQLVRHVVSLGVHAHHAPGIEHGLSADARATLSEYDDALNRCVREVLEQGQQRGVFRRDLTPDIDVVLVRHMLNGLVEQSVKAPDETATIATTGARTILAAVAER